MVNLIIFLSNCRPVAKSWNQTLEGSCSSLVTEQVITAVLVMVLDIIIAILPIPILWGLNMPTGKKWGIMLLFSLGLVWVQRFVWISQYLNWPCWFRICGLNLARIILTVRVEQDDFTYSLINLAIFAGLEIWVGIIIACIPTLQPCWRKIRDSALYTLNMSKHRSSYLASADEVPLRDILSTNDQFQRIVDDPRNNQKHSNAWHS